VPLDASHPLPNRESHHIARWSMVTNRIDREDARIIVEGPLSFSNLHYLLATIYSATNKAGYQDLILDLSKCFFVLPGVILAVCAQLLQLRQNGIYCTLRLPANDRLRRLFLNANWAHLLDPRGYDPSRFRGYSDYPQPSSRDRKTNRRPSIESRTPF
jgi:hypothetical protein